jgi:hypothetical protein
MYISKLFLRCDTSGAPGVAGMTGRKGLKGSVFEDCRDFI